MTSQSLKKITFKLNQDMEDYPPLEFESLWGIQIKPHTYKVDNIPYYIYGVSKGDIILAIERAVAGAECNTVIELKPEHHAA
ncbi:DUF4265 domain-containing protein [Pseudomonas sp. FSL R10-2245]|uniref:DUF4265 domain-containing protein n=1 Tax=Pseudomonas sp. FSL R10-2245 TaxID=2662200 RepID=UPI0012949B3E|nr:DUF4265 domain-containing protein [Pseudomonas sp. FSL R10-2245]MQU03479.1 DUF4265 domain-containing protein [Pseudomonas sp. FSL R10-2245]